MRNNIIKIVKILLIYCLFTVICGIIKTDLLLGYVDPKLKNLAYFSTYISLLIGFAIAFTTMLIIAASSYTSLFLLEQSVDIKNFIAGFYAYVIILTLSELVKTIAFHKFFANNFLIVSEKSIYLQAEKSGWNNFTNTIDLFTIFIGGFCFFLVFVILEKWKYVPNILISTITIVFLMIILRLHFILTIFKI